MQIKNILSNLSSFETITGERDAQLKAFKWIKNQLKGLPLYFKQLESNKVPSLLITTKETKKPVLWLAGHLDVVGGSPKVFKPYIKGSRLYGRGVFDMKFAIACYIKLFQDLGKSLKNYDMGIMITTDEEVGGWNGTKYLVDKGYSSKVCLLPDGGKNWEMQRSAKGVWHIKLQSLGKSAHGSRTWLGANAIAELAAFLLELSDLFPKEPCGSKYHRHPTINIGKISGGKSINQIPDSAEAFVDIRYMDKVDKMRIDKKLVELKKKYKKISVETLIFANSYKFDLKGVYYRLFSKIARDGFGISMKPVDSHGSSDGRFFVEKNIPILLMRPKGGGHHTEGEWIDLKDLDRFYLVVKKFAEQTALNK